MIFNWLGMGVFLGSAAIGYAVQGVVGQVGTVNTVANLVGFVVARPKHE